jgi:SagB-type dehydrogenase family enzyme
MEVLTTPPSRFRYADRVELDRRAFLALVGGTLGWGQVGCAEATPPAHANARDLHGMTSNTWLGARGVRTAPPSPPPTSKAYPGAGRIRLPHLSTLADAPLEAVVRGYAPGAGFGAEEVTLEEVAGVLRLANGVTALRGEGPARVALRAAPSAGALYAGEIYLVAERVRDLEPGVYYYAVLEHALVPLRTGPAIEGVVEALEQPSQLAGAAAAIVLTNVFARYAQRYANRGYRYALIDSGHIGANLRLAAHAAGMADTSPARFQDDALNHLLGVDGGEEAACAVHGLGRPGPDAPPLPRRPLVEQGIVGRGLLADLAGAIGRGHEATKLVPGPGASEVPDPVGEPSDGRDALDLPEARSVGVALGRCIEVRRSASHFLSRPILLEDLGFVLEMAAGHPRLARAPGVELRVVVHRVRNLAPGLYRYEPTAHALSPLRQGAMRPAMSRACLGQKKAASAAVGIVLAGRLHSARGYRDLLLEAGEVAQRVYLAAEALGLAARNLAAFVDDALDAIADLDGSESAAVHLTMLGPGD